MAALLSACNTNPFLTQPTDTGTPPVALTESFDGSLTVNGAFTHPFIVERAGGVTATLRAMEPTEATIGISLGTWNTGSNVCQIILANDTAVAGAVVVGTAAVAGNFCVRLYDVGKLTGPLLYSVDIVHF